MDTLYNTAIIETNGIRTIAGGGTGTNVAFTLLPTVSTTYIIQLSDNNTIIGSDNNTTGLSAYPSNSITYPIGYQTAVLQLSTTKISLSGAGSPKISNSFGLYKTARQFATASLLYTGSAYGWVSFGDVGS
jgi:hypothetical protein